MSSDTGILQQCDVLPKIIINAKYCIHNSNFLLSSMVYLNNSDKPWKAYSVGGLTAFEKSITTSRHLLFPKGQY